ncbi:MAG: pyridoxal phosphate-dependent aminotransferase [Dehalococcoidales bacterium]
MSLPPRPEIANLKVCPHGGINYAELKALGIAPEAVLDFSVCTNPFMPPPGIRKMLNHVAIEQYPDCEATELRERLSERLMVSPENILAGSGTTELIRLIALAYFSPGDSILIIEPTYGEYEVAAQIAGAESIKQWARVENNFAPEVEDTIALIKEHHPKAVFICNPNNPTGKYFSRPEIEMVLAAIGDGLLILDEAYLAFVEKPWSSLDLASQGNVVILRSMTKEYGLAGLRLGYTIARQEITDNLRRVRPPWNVNAVAQKIGTAVLEAADYLERSKQKISKAKQFLIDGLSRLGFQLLPSDANYFLVRVGDAKSFRTVLLRHGLQVRDCTSFALPEYIRIAPRTLPECRKLIDTMAKLKENGELGAST